MGEVSFLERMTRVMIMFEVSCILIYLVNEVPSAEGRVHNYTWEVSYQYKYLDCYKKLAIAINGITPGPAIYAVQGDTIIVNVVNNLVMENVAIHWHGIRQVYVLVSVSSFTMLLLFRLSIFVILHSNFRHLNLYTKKNSLYNFSKFQNLQDFI